MTNFDFFITSMPPSRPADYYLACLEGSVFLDFNELEDGRIYLIRISFDGYGCCNLGDSAIPLNKEDSNNFKQIVHNNVINQNEIEVIVRRAISLNETLIWEEALEEYQFI